MPFLIVNGILTALPVVRYNPGAILGPRIGTIPFEDALYCFALFVLPVALYQAFTGSDPRGSGSVAPIPASKPAPNIAQGNAEKRLLRAHRLHHASENREGSSHFGFLWAAQKAN